ncbi:flagellar hook-basal body complex protein FliE [Bacillus sp. B-jedd]|uniref:flagellar hook-basal body complex protein FliE n=1 Tax=Bacillus sp. B-jedd TaxID=1476857 RepID=UPI0005156EB3|nr:flagellar hook-basal body complex protein FliE [Bacillus sp. B-jedd]CEG25915.1 flagellar hook-basal body protein FliE [Bacillus sp. B-jedd]
MDISRLNSDFMRVDQNPFQKTEAKQYTSSFANVIKGYLDQVDSTVKDASALSVKAAAGTLENVHDLTIASQKAKLALELTVTVRDKAIESYQEIMRMQM